MFEAKLLIDGAMRSSSKTFDSIDPSNGNIIAKAYLPSSQDIEDAVMAADRAFHNSPWSTSTPQARAELLLNISAKIKERKNELIEWEVKDSGSTLRKATADVFNTSSYFKVLAGLVSNFKWEMPDEAASRAGFSKNSRQYCPIGVCAQIIPWNFPLVMAGWKIGPVIATGCTSVLKSAAETPVTASLLGQILIDSGVPKGVINIVTGGAQEGEALVTHPLVRKVAFTGSTKVGKHILAQAAPHLKHVTLELGGKSANIVLPDADLSLAVDGALYAFLYHQGQACDSGTRLLVHESIKKDFLGQFLERLKAVKVGLTSDPTSGFGPVVSKKQFDTVMNYISGAKKEGAKLLAGGEPLRGAPYDQGFFIPPTAFEITPAHTIWKEEIFGPVVGITSFSSDEEALALANNSDYGLAAAVWSKDAERARTIARRLQAGTVWINEYHLLNPGMPFGGFKQSGLGREMGPEGLLSYLEVKHLWESDCNERPKKTWFDAIF